ncbi:MAG: hypothetical protein ACRCZF_00015 [Gemmataceae bacterium]
MTATLFCSLLMLAEVPQDPMKLLQATFDRRLQSNVALEASIQRETVEDAGQPKSEQLKLKYRRFNNKEYCELVADDANPKRHFKMCQGCYPPDDSKILTNDVDKKVFGVYRIQEAQESRLFFDLRWIGYNSFLPEATPPEYPRPYTLDIYLPPVVNLAESKQDLVCIEVPTKAKTGSLKYFVNSKSMRVEKLTITNSESASKVQVESFYHNDNDLFPHKVSKSTTRKNFRRTEEIIITETRPLTKLSDISWDPELVDFRPNIFVTGSTIEKKKVIQDSFFYDGKVIRKPTKKDDDLYGIKTEPAEIITTDNARRTGRSSFLYAIPLVLFGTALVLFYRKWRSRPSE